MTTVDELVDIFDLPLLPWSPPWIVVGVLIILILCTALLSRRKVLRNVPTYPGPVVELVQICSASPGSISPDRLSRVTRRVLEQALRAPVSTMSNSELKERLATEAHGRYRALGEALLLLESARYLAPETIPSAIDCVRTVVREGGFDA